MQLAARGLGIDLSTAGKPPEGHAPPLAVEPPAGVRIGGMPISFALDNGASFSFVSDDVLERPSRNHPDWSRGIGALGCANIWEWWPGEAEWPVMRGPGRTSRREALQTALVGTPSADRRPASLVSISSKKAGSSAHLRSCLV